MPEFEHSVDFYNQKDKVAIEVEKAEIKRVVHDVLKMINATKTFRSKISYGILIVPEFYFANKHRRPFLATLKADLAFYFGSLLEDSKLKDLLIIVYKVLS